MHLTTLHDLFVHELMDIFSAELLLMNVLPKVARAADSEHLRDQIDEQLKETESQIERLEMIARSFAIDLADLRCPAMEGLIREGREALEEDAEAEVRDAALIAIVQKMKHYEIATYGTLVTFARMMGYDEPVLLLQKTLDEEKQIDRNLSELAELEVNVHAQI